ncbi:MAG: tRNA (N6-isopentenyl adenosine(37)-C2)-methylthiotransferase MiaB, partial [Candidatus Phosphoribacter baldrii]
PHHLVADSAAHPGGRYAVRRTSGGDAWAALQGKPTGGGKPAVSAPIGLGMPSLGVPASVPAAGPGCG